MEPSISLGQSHSPITRVIKIIIQVQYNINVVLTPINDHYNVIKKLKTLKSKHMFISINKNNQCT
jgi:spore coat polysaccharide biosynthesis predicted glycosyltransferase SpsG